jgi:hypothetical protein
MTASHGSHSHVQWHRNPHRHLNTSSGGGRDSGVRGREEGEGIPRWSNLPQVLCCHQSPGQLENSQSDEWGDTN